MNMKTWKLVRAVSVVWAVCSVPLMAATAVWTNTVNGSVGSWAGSGNWNAATYPGQSATGESAFLTNAVSSVYTAKVDSAIPNSIAKLTMQNGGSGGQVWLVVANGSLTNTGITTNGLGSRLVIDAGGQLCFGNSVVIDSQAGLGADSVVITNGGIASNTASTANLVVGGSTAYNQVSIRGGSKLYSGGGSLATRNLIGRDVGASGNTMLVADAGSLWQTAADIGVGYYGDSGNALIVSNGATVVCGGSAFYTGVYGSNCLTLVTGSGSSLTTTNTTGSAYAGYNSASNRLEVRNGGMLSVAGALNIGGNNASANSNSVGNSFLLTDPQTYCWVGGIFTVGYKGGPGNSMIISNGAQLVMSNQTTYISHYTTNDFVVVTGNGSMWSNAASGSLTFGKYGGVGGGMTIQNGGRVRIFTISMAGASTSSGNSLIITNGGLLTTAGINLGDSGPRNTVWIGGNDPITGDPSVWSVGSLLLGASAASSVSNQLIVDAGGVVTNVAGSYGLQVGAASGANYNSVIVTNGGKIYISSIGMFIAHGASKGNSLTLNGGTIMNAGGSTYVADGGGTNNSLLVANGVLDDGAFSIFVGSAAGSTPGISNTLTVTGSGVITNLGGNGKSLAVGAAVNANYNSISITNGGLVYMNAGTISVGAYSAGSAGGNSNTLTVAGGVLRTDADSYVGAVSTGNIATVSGSALWYGSNNKVINVGYGNAAGNRLNVAGGQIFGVSSVVVGTNAVGGANSVNVTGGGLLEASNLVAGAGNQIANTGSVYQFTTTNMAIAGPVSVNNGIVSLRNVRGADVNGNVTGSSLANMTFSGNNAFRLNNATNSTAAANPQTYTFKPASAPVYAGLELVNGNTAYTNGDVTINAGGWLTFSNTTAIMWENVTNSGTMSVINSTVTFSKNLVLGEGCTLNQTSNSTVSVTGALSLPASATFNLSGIVGASDQVVLFQATGGITGSAAGWSVSPYDHRVSVSSDGTRLMLLPTRRGLMFIVE